MAAGKEDKQEEEEEDDEDGGVSRFQDAMSNLSDALLPVRGHGLIELTRLLDEADPETVSNAARAVDALRENLEDDDTYIYLQVRMLKNSFTCTKFTVQGDPSKG